MTKISGTTNIYLSLTFKIFCLPYSMKVSDIKKILFVLTTLAGLVLKVVQDNCTVTKILVMLGVR